MQTRTVEPMTRPTVPEVTFGALYQEHHPRVLAYFLRRFDRETALDCAADVFTVAWRRHDELPNGEEAVPWLYGVCRNVGLNQERSRRRVGRLFARLRGQRPVRPPRPDIEAVRSAEHGRAIEALQRLRSADREILLLSTWEELPREDIARILGCSRHAVDQRIQRATKRLRREFGTISPAEPGGSQ